MSDERNERRDDVALQLGGARATMRSLRCVLVLSGVVLVFGGRVRAEEADAALQQEAKVEAALRTFYSGIANRDADAVRSVIDPSNIMIDHLVEGGAPSVRLEKIDIADPKSLLPPEGNHDWENVQIKDVKVAIARPMGAVAHASLILFTPVDDEQIATWKSILDREGKEMRPTDREELNWFITERAISFEIFATLVKKGDGKWRIICLSFPR
ncbi:MAG TPA: hypothetical protein VHD36_21500 [Pirellulales bacterium]|nr:hypothetical protein [Pirellulales bacterium]